jgi:hypothetical protein
MNEDTEHLEAFHLLGMLALGGLAGVGAGIYMLVDPSFRLKKDELSMDEFATGFVVIVMGVFWLVVVALLMKMRARNLKR